MSFPVVRNIRVFTLEHDAITVEWEIGETTEDLTQYSLRVLRSESEAGPYNPVSQTLVASDVFDFNDRSVNILSKWREFFYRIELTRTSDARSEQFGSVEPKKVLEGADPGGVVMEAPPDLEALEAIRRFDLVLKEFGGRTVLALNQRSWGQRCTDCWDRLKRRQTKSRCLTCFDTGLTGGYFSPMESHCMKPPHQVLVALTPLFEMQPNDVVMWFSASPRLKPRDLVIDIDGRRWRTIKINRSEKGWALTRQTVQLRQLSRDQVEYKIPIDKDDWGVDNLTVGPLRQHIRATDIDSYNAAVQALGFEDEEVFESKSDFATDLEHSNADS